MSTLFSARITGSIVGLLAAAGVFAMPCAVQAQCTYPQIILGDAPQAYWRLGEAASPFASAVANTPALVGGSQAQVPGAIAGDSNGCVRLSGTSLSSNTNLSPIVEAGTGPYSLEAWVMPEVTLDSNFQDVFFRSGGDGGGSYSGMALQFSASAVRFRTAIFPAQQFFTQFYAGTGHPFTFSVGQWYHFVVVADPSVLTNNLPTATVYVNGVVVGTSNYDRLTFQGGQLIFNSGAGARYCRIDEAAVYARALSAVDVLDHFHAAGENLTITQHPVSRAICDGAPTQFTVGVTASGPMAFQWRRNLVDIPNATAQTLFLAAATFADAGQYDCIVTTACGSATSAPATLTVLDCGSPAAAPLTVFTYQGQLKNGGTPADGAFDLRFRLYSAATGGSQLGSTLCLDDVPVSGGLFTVPLDFGNVFSNAGSFLEVDVRANAGADCGNANGFTTLSPRQPVTPAPAAIYAQSAGTARFVEDALNAENAVNAQNAVTAQTAVNATNAVSAQTAQTAVTATSATTATTAITANSATTAGSATTAATADNALALDGHPSSYYTNLDNQTGLFPWSRISGAPTSMPLALPYVGSVNAPGTFAVRLTNTGGSGMQVLAPSPVSGFAIMAESLSRGYGVFGNGAWAGVAGYGWDVGVEAVAGASTGPTSGLLAKSYSPQGIAVQGVNLGGGWGGYFVGTGYFSEDVGIGTTDPQAKLDVAGGINVGSRVRFPDGTEQDTALPRGTIQGQKLVWSQQAHRWDLDPPSVADPPPPASAPTAGSQVFNADGEFTVPVGVVSILVELWGAGAGGSAGSPCAQTAPVNAPTVTGAGGRGGGSGAYSALFMNVTEGQVYSVRVGGPGTSSRLLLGTNELLAAYHATNSYGAPADLRANIHIAGNSGRVLSDLEVGLAALFGGATPVGGGAALLGTFEPRLRSGGGGNGGHGAVFYPGYSNCGITGVCDNRPPQYTPETAGAPGEPGLCRISW